MLQSSDLPEKNTEKLKIKCFFIIFLNLVFYFLNVPQQKENIKYTFHWSCFSIYSKLHCLKVNLYAIFYINISKSISDFKLKSTILKEILKQPYVIFSL